MNFEDMEVWKRAVKLSSKVYKETSKLKDYGFKDQIGRASLSIPSNIAEGMERISIKESLNFLSYAKASCGELYTQIIIGQEINYLNTDTASQMKLESKAISKMLGSLITKRKSFINTK
ncbi:four helix bundle protein [Aliikangiella marina]|uniref:Four helix bundle protein n=1 Tax=Aliikangiella marina TaxID=1712262 RepID=A0A545TIH1_9GAMM|nr:four helix bundle protein [Aliikangiella marina]TQV77024.1 four helix bundle protein [Aliikangiella marina]